MQLTVGFQDSTWAADYADALESGLPDPVTMTHRGCALGGNRRLRRTGADCNAAMAQIIAMAGRNLADSGTSCP